MNQSSEAQDLEERLAQLESENKHLKESAISFGDLAERLNERLRELQVRDHLDA